MNQMATGRNSELEHALATITGAPGSKPDWQLVANTVERVRESGAWQGTYPSPTEWLDAAAEASKYTTNTIRRFIAAWKFLEKLRSKEKNKKSLLVKSTSDLAIGTVELIKRMHDISPEEAQVALSEHLEKKLSFRDAKKRYDNMFPTIDPFAGSGAYVSAGDMRPHFLQLDAGKIGSRRAHAAGRGLTELISSSIEKLSGPGSTRVRTIGFKFDYASPDAIASGRSGAVPFVDGFSYRRLPSTASKAALIKFIGEIAFASTFFRRYWIIADGRRDEAEAFANSLNELEIKSIGIALIDAGEKDRLALIRTPSAPPIPDRTESVIKAALLADKPRFMTLREAAKLQSS